MDQSTLPAAITPGELAVVVGAGISGLAAAQLLCKLGAKVRLLEKNVKKVPQEFRTIAETMDIDIRCGEHNTKDFADASLIVPCPGVAASRIRPFLPKENPPAIMAETELAWRQLQGETVIAVTGTSGKTTTTSLCAAMLEDQGFHVFTGGNIGIPLSKYILMRYNNSPKVDMVVLELSSFQLQTCSTLCPHIALLLNISANHLDYHADMHEYISAKMRIFANQDESDFAIIHRGLEDIIQPYHIKSRIIWYETPQAPEDLHRFSGIRLLGEHNLANAEAAWLACKQLGVTSQAASHAVSQFQPIEHRLERVAECKGVLFVNDSKCTTVEALHVALNSFADSILLLAGGKFKGGDLQTLRSLMKEKVRHLALYGANRQVFEDAFSDILPISWDETLEQATRRLATMAKSGDIILLAPATASFDQYANYLRRGEDFKRIVKILTRCLTESE